MTTSPSPSVSTFAAALEKPHILHLPQAPWAIPDPDEVAALVGPPQPGSRRRDWSLDVVSGRFLGHANRDTAVARRIHSLLEDFAREAAAWLLTVCPGYRHGLTPDRVLLRTEDEATRSRRISRREDLLHLDHFPRRPTLGRRILRVCANLHPAEPQVWAVSEPFDKLLAWLGHRHPIPRLSKEEWIQRTRSRLHLFRSGRPDRSPYDRWRQRLDEFLRNSDPFQSRATRRIVTFAPRSAWLFYSDALTHAQLRGRLAFEQTFFVDPTVLAAPDNWPVAILAASTAQPSRRAG